MNPLPPAAALLRHALALFPRQPGASSTPLHFVELFLLIAEHEPLTYQKLEDLTGFSSGTSSRAIRAMSHVDRHHRPGLGLVDIDTSIPGTQRHIITLSQAGRQLLADIADLQPEAPGRKPALISLPLERRLNTR